MIKSVIKKIAPNFCYNFLANKKRYIIYVIECYKIKKEAEKQKAVLKRLAIKDTIKCVFLGLFSEVWKYDTLYRLMESNPQFDPVILVCPIVNYGYKNMVSRMNECYHYFEDKGYNVIRSYDEKSNSYIDLCEDMHPDIVFYTNPYKGLIDERYFITHLKDVLSVYVPYYFNEGVGYETAYNTLFQNMLWRRYVETDFHKQLSIDNSRNKGRNSVVTGYPGIEPLIKPNCFSNDSQWKIKDRRFKRIIWAPHHTLEAAGTCHYSCFLMYHKLMLGLAKKYQDQVQFVFKPHPLLKNKLYLLWGKEKTDVYYGEWEMMPNASLKEGDYIDLFLTSDAMIHDSGSFLIEYLYVNKPVLRTLNGIALEKLYNPFALKCLDNYYLANNEQDIEQFIQNVINGVDPLKEQRTKFVNEVLMPKGSPSQNIIDDILDSIDNQILYRN